MFMNLFVMVCVWLIAMGLVYRFRKTPCRVNKTLARIIYGSEFWERCDDTGTSKVGQVGHLNGVEEVEFSLESRPNVYEVPSDWLVLYELSQTRNDTLLSLEDVTKEIQSAQDALCLHHSPDPETNACDLGFELNGECCEPSSTCLKEDGYEEDCDLATNMILPMVGMVGKEYGISKMIDKLTDAFLRKKTEKIYGKLLDYGFNQWAYRFKTRVIVEELIETELDDVWTKAMADAGPNPSEDVVKRKLREAIADGLEDKVLNKWSRNFADGDIARLHNMIQRNLDELMSPKAFESLLAASKMFQKKLMGVESVFKWALRKNGKDLLQKVASLAGKKIAPRAVAKAMGKMAVRVAVKTGAKLSRMGAKMLAYMAAGPIGVALFIFEVMSLTLDLWDPYGFNMITSLDVVRKQRDKIELSIRHDAKRDGTVGMTVHPRGKEVDTDGPMLFPVASVFPTQFGLANKMYTSEILGVLQEHPVLGAEYDLLFDSIVEQTRAADILFEDPIIIDTSGCAYPLPQYGRIATTAERESLNAKNANSILGRCSAEEEEEGSCMTANDWAQWSSLGDTGDWAENPAYATANGRGCAVEDETCPCGTPLTDEDGVLIEKNTDEDFEGFVFGNAAMFEEILSDKIVALSNRLPPRTRSRVFYECLLTQLAAHSGTDPVTGEPREFPELRHHVCFCPEMLPDDGPENALFTDYFRAVSLTEVGSQAHYDELTGGKVLTQRFKTNHPYFPVWSKHYRVRDPTDPGTTVYPRAARKTIPELDVYTCVLEADVPAFSSAFPGAKITENPEDSRVKIAQYRTDVFSQLSGLGQILDSCVSKLDKSTNDLMSGIHKGGHHCVVYRQIDDVDDPTWTETEETRLLEDGNEGKCASKAQLLNQTAEPTEDGGEVFYYTKWEPRGDYKNYLKTRMDINPTDYGVTFDHDTGLCNYTADYCMRFGLQRVYNEELGDHDCETFAAQEFLELIFGTTMTRMAIIEAMKVDRQYQWINNKLATSCHGGIHSFNQPHKAMADVFEKSASCSLHYAMTAVRAYVQVGIAASGVLLAPLSAAFEEFTNQLVDGGACLYKAAKEMGKGDGPSGEDLQVCMDVNVILFSTIAASLVAFQDARADLERSFADAAGDIAAVFGLDGQAVENAVQEAIDFATKYSGMDLAVSVAIDVASFLSENSANQGWKDDTIVTPMFLVGSLRIGKNTNVCVAGVCADDVVRSFSKGIKKWF